MCVHNGAQHLGEAIESIVNQTMKDFQFVIVDDASTDNSREVSNKRKKRKEERRVKIEGNIEKHRLQFLFSITSISKAAF